MPEWQKRVIKIVTNLSGNAFDLAINEPNTYVSPLMKLEDDAKSAIYSLLSEAYANGVQEGQRHGRANEHHVISRMLSNEELAKLEPSTLRGLKNRQKEILQAERGE